MNKLNLSLLILLLIFNVINIAQVINKPNEILPVELTYFVGDVVDSTVELRWETATEINNFGYDLLRSDTSFTWIKIGFISGAGSSNSPKEYLYVDTTITENGKYYYLLNQIDTDGVSELQHDTVKIIVDYITSVEEIKLKDNLSPSKFKLFQNYPNPFNPETNITFYAMYGGNVTLELYSVNGERLEPLFNGNVIAGTHTFKFNANYLSSGTYIYKLSIGNISISKKMLLIK